MKHLKYKKSLKKNKKYKRKTIKNKNKKQIGGELSNNCIREILKMAFKEDEDLTEPQITVLVDKFMSISTLWRNYPNLFGLLNNINANVDQNLNYNEHVDWTNDIVEHLINEQEIN